MEKINIISKKDYKALFEKKVNYLVQMHEKVGYGGRTNWLKAFLWNITHKYGKYSYKHEYYLQFYRIYVYLDNPAWDAEVMTQLIKDKKLNPGDIVDVSALVPSSDNSHWCAGVITLVILEDGWKVIRKSLGE